MFGRLVRKVHFTLYPRLQVLPDSLWSDFNPPVNSSVTKGLVLNPDVKTFTDCHLRIHSTLSLFSKPGLVSLYIHIYSLNNLQPLRRLTQSLCVWTQANKIHYLIIKSTGTLKRVEGSKKLWKICNLNPTVKEENWERRPYSRDSLPFHFSFLRLKSSVCQVEMYVHVCMG